MKCVLAVLTTKVLKILTKFSMTRVSFHNFIETVHCILSVECDKWAGRKGEYDTIESFSSELMHDHNKLRNGTYSARLKMNATKLMIVLLFYCIFRKIKAHTAINTLFKKIILFSA